MESEILTETQSYDDLLATKLEIPLLGSRIVTRRRLTGLLQTTIDRQVTIIVAPTGYGKTTLLGDWLAVGNIANRRIAWVSLDLFDNNLHRFWNYIIAALQKVYPRLRLNSSGMNRPAQDSIKYDQLNHIINEIVKFSHPVCLVLDDYQVINDEQIHQEVSYLIDHQPKNLHLILSSRVTPPLMLSRLRAQGRLLEISAPDLSFTVQEVNVFLSNVMNLTFNYEQAAALKDATEGWIAGLKLAAISLQRHPDFQRLLSDLPGGNRQIVEYLTEEVLSQQDVLVKDFLLKTSILSELSAPLCDALLDRSDSHDMLRKIERANLFIVPLDNRRRWFRYHHLFAEILQSHLRESYPDSIAELQQRACSWLHQNGYPDKAVSHALAAGDLESAAQIIDTSALQAVIVFDLTKLTQWINRFSSDLLSKRPRLGIYSALANYLMGQMDNVEPKLAALEQALERTGQNQVPVEDEQLVRWEIKALRAVVQCFSEDVKQGIVNILELRKDQPKKDVYFYGLMTHCLAEAYTWNNPLKMAVEEYEKGCQFAIVNGLQIEYAYSQSELAHLRKMQGHLKESEQEYKHLLDYSIQANMNIQILAFAQTGLAEIALERNELKTAGQWMKEVIEQFEWIEFASRLWVRPEWLHLRLARYYLALDDLQSAVDHFQNALRGFKENRYVVPFLSSDLIDIQVRIWAASGELNDLTRSFQEEIATLNPFGKSNIAEKTALVRIKLAQSHPDHALNLLDELEQAAHGSGMGERLIEIMILKALAQQMNAQNMQALHSIETALLLAEPEGYMHLFLAEGKPLKILLGEYLRTAEEIPPQAGRPSNTGFARQVLAAYETIGSVSHYHPLQKSEPDPVVSTPLLEPLTERELEILHLLAAGISTKEMTTHLVISLSTAKTHLRSIYRKLGVHNRKMALERAKEQGLFNTHS